MATATSGVSPVGNKFYTTTVTKNNNGSLTSVTSRTDAQGKNAVPVKTVNAPAGGGSPDVKYEIGATPEEQTAFKNPNSPEGRAFTQHVTDPKLQNKVDANTSTNKTAFNNLAGKPNAATNSPAPDGQAGTPPTSEQSAALNEEFKAGDKGGTRNSYGDFKYPLNLKLEVQDVIKFSILKYVPSLSTTGQSTISKTGRIVTLKDGIPIVGGSEKIGTITLPIPAGINDSNTVSWQQDSLNVLQKEGAKTAKGFFEGGVEGGAAEGGGAIEDKTSDPKALKQAISGLLMSVATQGGNIQGRAYGSVNNNNLEVLFGGPGLRSFSFQFSFYPREPEEAIEVRKIIRTFKQSMSVKRSANSLLLKAPHTFAISYLTAGQKAHPYLNRFKECALTSCNIDYTPDGTYMTYGGDEKSMTAYRMTLSFSELEPIFDDEYGATDYDNIGF